MANSEKYEKLNPEWKSQVDLLIRKMCGKSHIADIIIEDSELESYEFKVTVNKYNNSGSKGWATIGYLRNDIFRGGIWRLTYQPRLRKGERSDAGKTGSYG